MTDKELKDWCKNCDVEPPAMKFKCPECEHNPDKEQIKDSLKNHSQKFSENSTQEKEQIIIDGVDVSECVSFDKLNGQNICCYEDTREDKISFANFCVENKDCYFKQLARKTQECEELKKELDKEHLLMLEKQDKATRYFLVLNGIKEYIYNNTDFDVNDSIQSKTSGYDILQIIKDV